MVDCGPPNRLGSFLIIDREIFCQVQANVASRVCHNISAGTLRQ